MRTARLARSQRPFLYHCDLCLFSFHAHRAPSLCQCQLCIHVFPKLKRDLSVFEVSLGPLMLLFKNCLHEGKRARFLWMQMKIYVIHKQAVRVKQRICPDLCSQREAGRRLQAALICV